MSSSNILGDMINETLTKSFPAQVTALTEARKENASELARLQEVLSDLEEKIIKGKEEKNRLAIEVNGLLSKLHAIGEEGSQKKLNITELERKVTRASSLNETLKWKLNQKEEKSYLSDKNCTRCKEKVDILKRKISLHESAEAVKKELKMIRILTDSMVAKKEKLEKTCSEMCAAESESINEDDKTKLLNSKLNELQDLQEERKHLQLNNHILQKKNSALLIRLKKQAKEQEQKQILQLI